MNNIKKWEKEDNKEQMRMFYNSTSEGMFELLPTIYRITADVNDTYRFLVENRDFIFKNTKVSATSYGSKLAYFEAYYILKESIPDLVMNVETLGFYSSKRNVRIEVIIEPEHKISTRVNVLMVSLPYYAHIENINASLKLYEEKLRSNNFKSALKQCELTGHFSQPITVTYKLGISPEQDKVMREIFKENYNAAVYSAVVYEEDDNTTIKCEFGTITFTNDSSLKSYRSVTEKRSQYS